MFPNYPFSLAPRWISRIAAALIVLVVSVVVVVNVQIKDLSKQWKSYSELDLRKRQLLRDIRVAAGYSGFIHHFKNFIVRRERSDYIEAGEKLAKLEQSIAEFSRFDLTPAERQAL